MEDFVTYDIAFEMHELGFDKPCFGYFISNHGIPDVVSCEYGNEKESSLIRRKEMLCSAPLYQQVIDWLRDVKKIDIQILRNKPGYNEYMVEIYQIYDNGEYFHSFITDENHIKWFSNYKEARKQAILKAIELYKKEK